MTTLQLFGDTESSSARPGRCPEMTETCGSTARLLLAEDLRDTLRRVAAEHSATCPAEMMVASVRTGFGHDPGSCPLSAGLPIQVDLFPRDETSGCWADMTRTFVVGEPTTENAALIAEQEQLVITALEQARAAIRPGVTGRELFDATEPGLWDPRIGGVRFEDLLLVTDDGSETLTRFSYSLTPST